MGEPRHTGDAAPSGGAPRLKVRQTEKGIAIAVRLTPKSARDAVEGVEEFGGDPVLKARVRAVPENGRANTALETLIADWLEVPRSSVSIAHGSKARIKIVAVDGNAIVLSALIATRLAEFRNAGG
ncbi:DUF167 family protein [Methyloceanibacter sp.]|uniref:DUF167 family protein n=1 Tax=Methyloceanibacter sp. TaxID=1965321 RepID=UPI00208362EE|nr:DUF167 family protein [Methyloceanibacter sp.]GFO81235.1 MAG: hypothetical protein A49_08620 [Methyloceanibacter sp.]HML91509.1 DUF167 family protein [Methyloceanibacter sp.]